MWGEAAQWSPWEYLHQHHPDVQLVEDVELLGQLQGCVDHKARIIWLDARLCPVARRSTLAYEIGHLEHGPTPADPCLAAAHRRDAEEWAARMLIPICDLLIGFAASTYIPEIADRLEVDSATLRTRCRSLTDDEQDAVMDAIRGMQAVV